MKKLFPILLSLAFIITIAISAAYLWWVRQLSPVSPADSQLVSLVIPKNQNNIQTLRDLQSKRLIRSITAAKVYLRLNKLDQKILPGAYAVSQSMSLPAIFTAITAGPQDIWVTLPEGWRREQMAIRLSQALGGSFDPLEFIAKSASIEGSLFPDTYLIPASANVTDVINILTNNFSKKSNLNTQNSYLITLDGLAVSYTGREILILASLVERETNASADRPVVAGILMRRLRLGMPLQVDASLQYAAGSSRCSSSPLDCNYWQPIFDTKVPSAYNTYLNSGLPPAPIANPGLSSINAVLTPKSGTYLYYITGNDGVTYFADTLTGHNLNIDKYLKN